MKSSCFILFPVLIFFAFATKLSPALANASPEAVRDISGKKVISGQEYYILPVVRGRGGGLTLGAPRNGSCPLDVIQDRNQASKGLPLTFTPVDQKKGTIRVNTDLNVKFSAATICLQSTVWRLQLDKSIGQQLVTSGGAQGNPGLSTLSDWFKVEKYEDDYKLVFCPTVCNNCKPVCGDIGIYIKHGVRRLALSDHPLKVMFMRV